MYSLPFGPRGSVPGGGKQGGEWGGQPKWFRQGARRTSRGEEKKTKGGRDHHEGGGEERGGGGTAM